MAWILAGKEIVICIARLACAAASSRSRSRQDENLNRSILVVCEDLNFRPNEEIGKKSNFMNYPAASGGELNPLCAKERRVTRGWLTTDEKLRGAKTPLGGLKLTTEPAQSGMTQ